MVAPYAGAWIEINSMPSIFKSGGVAPYAGAWIEIAGIRIRVRNTGVAPYAGAWIEIKKTQIINSPFWSLPTRERGLKLGAGRIEQH